MQGWWSDEDKTDFLQRFAMGNGLSESEAAVFAEGELAVTQEGTLVKPHWVIEMIHITKHPLNWMMPIMLHCPPFWLVQVWHEYESYDQIPKHIRPENIRHYTMCKTAVSTMACQNNVPSTSQQIKEENKQTGGTTGEEPGEQAPGPPAPQRGVDGKQRPPGEEPPFSDAMVSSRITYDAKKTELCTNVEEAVKVPAGFGGLRGDAVPEKMETNIIDGVSHGARITTRKSITHYTMCNKIILSFAQRRQVHQYQSIMSSTNQQIKGESKQTSTGRGSSSQKINTRSQYQQNKEEAPGPPAPQGGVDGKQRPLKASTVLIDQLPTHAEASALAVQTVQTWCTKKLTADAVVIISDIYSRG